MIGLAVMWSALWGFATTPTTLGWQFTAGALAVLVAILLPRRSRLMLLLLMALSIAFSTRYLYWRYTETLPIGPAHTVLDLVLAIGLIAAETYAYLILLLGYFQVMWPLQRRPVPLPENPDQWPMVDIYIPTYNEPLSVVKPTVLAALEMDWPQDRIKVYLLDDGRRPEFAVFAKQVGAVHMTRPDNNHAKAGNINHALTKTRGEFIAIFDCDHIPTRSFLQLTLGTLLEDPKMALVQTPHHFFSPDPFERNLKTFRKVPNEGELFYGLLQDGNDLWNAAFFCGSCAVIRRTALAEIGGIAVETVTEDAHTALRLHQRGWNSAYINIPQAAGLATESLSAHIGQRIRWARGMAQIFRVDNPLFAKGLKFGQRLCYTNAMAHFFYGLPRLVFLTSPMAFLLFGAQIIRAEALMIVAYALPHLALAVIANSRVQGRHRHSWWAEVYETVLATFIILPTTLALINPKLGKFNVTAKGGIVDRDYFDGDIAKPYFFLYLLNMLGIGVGIGRLFFGGMELTQTVYLNMAWATYNLIILGAALSVAGERKQLRRTVRVEDELKASVRRPGSRKPVQTSTFDVSTGGLALLPSAELADLVIGDAIEVSLESPGRRLWLPGIVRRNDRDLLTLEFDSLSIAQESSLTQSLFGRADAWMDWRDRGVRDKPLKAMLMIFRISLAGSAKFWRWVGRQSLQAMRLNRAAPARSGHGPSAVLLIAALLLGSGGEARAQPPATAPAAAKPEAASVLTARPAADPYAVATTAGVAKATSDQAVHETTRVLSFADLGVGFPLRLTTVFAQASVAIPLRRDQVVTAARLRLKFAHSPSLVGRFSSIAALVNDEVVDTFALDPATSARGERVIDINPALFLEFNQLRFDAAMHYVDVERECEDPTHTSLWSLISNQSTIELTLASLPQPANLSRLPRPFFEPNDPRRLRLPMAFSARPGSDAMTAAAITASWFGALADYRGAEFPVSYGNVLPRGHAVVLRSGREFEAQLGPVPDGVQLRVVAHPDDPGAKLLVLEASDDAGLIRAAQALSLGMATLDGAAAPIQELNLPPPPPRGSAPRWLDPDLAVRLGPLASGPTSVRGLTPGPISYDFRLPPDLWFYGNDGAELDVLYRYAPITAPGATLSTLLNEAFIASTTLANAGGNGAATADARITPDRSRISIPAGRLGASNRLSFQYQFRRIAAKPCESFQADALGGSIDPESSLKLGPHGRYAEWPDLGRFQSGGLPFSLQSDYGETAVLVPDNADEDALSATLMVAGHFGQITGAPALRIAVDGIGNGSQHADRELLLIGRQTQLALPQDWLAGLPVALGADNVTLKPPGAIDSLHAWASGRDLEGARSYAGRMLAGGGSDLGMIIGARSPFGSGSAVWLAAGPGVSLLSVAEALIDPSRRQFIEGDVALLRGTKVSGYLLGDRWGVGRLPLHRQFREWLSRRPWLMTPLALVFATLAMLLMYRSLSHRAARRLKGGGA
ncbi:MAG: cellulose synthase catalytic subunit (UDP-forming) [Xanthomonadaceae bacterium]|nr:cellulose synthase catalytic subunit (UDP-forming) [Xanthomonadaceae bacterium]